MVEHFSQISHQELELEEVLVQRASKAFEDFTDLNGTNLAIGLSAIGHA